MLSKKITYYLLGMHVKVGEAMFQNTSWFDNSRCKTSGNLIILTRFCFLWLHMVSAIK
jgi:hypothetical protein